MTGEFAGRGPALELRSMCGRYRLSRRKEILAEHMDTDFDELDWEPRYNIAPTQPVPVVRRVSSDSSRQATMLRWGLIPSWAADSKVAAQNINARSETAASKPSFRDPLRKQRCLIPADGFYEWKRAAKVKQPFCFEVGNGVIFAFAGLWDAWRGQDGQFLETCAILTTTPNELLADVHDRMPVILPAEQYGFWLDPAMQDVERAVSLLKPLDASQMRKFAVSTRVNVVSNDGPECSAPAKALATTGSLFG
jgi:putative SOS response-associated peptidase YedK